LKLRAARLAAKAEGPASPVLEVTRAAHLAAITIHVECADGVELQAVAAGAGREVIQKVKAYIGITAQVRIANPGSIERWAGKARHVIDRRNTQAGL